ncbi:MAG: hypothetical protein LBS36_10660 [Oscillospiraceae bacterium]|jgi:hypothetical protein|nr:hypothetical protein [Oscillospiraceae bacterium]
MTVEGLYNEYVAYKKYQIRETTLEKTKQILSSHVLPELIDKRLDKLDLATLKGWKQTIEEKPLSITTKKNIFAALRSVLNFGVKFEHLNSHPLNKLGNFVDAYASHPEIDYYTADDFKKFIAVARKFAEKRT